MSAGNKIVHDKCGTPDCCMKCDTSLFEEVPTNVVGGIPSLTDPTDAYALQKNRFKARLKMKMLRRKKNI